MWRMQIMQFWYASTVAHVDGRHHADDVTREAYRLLDTLSEQRRKIHIGKPSMGSAGAIRFPTEDGKLYVEMTQLQKLLTSKPKLVSGSGFVKNGYIVHYMLTDDMSKRS